MNLFQSLSASRADATRPPYRRFAVRIAATFAALVLSSVTAAQGFDAAAFQRFVDMRVGTGEPVYWYCEGLVYEYPSGKPLMRMEGIDAARRWCDPTAPLLAKQLLCKTFYYRDLRSGEALMEINGQPLAPIEYPDQFISYEQRGDRVRTFVEQGRAPQRANATSRSRTTLSWRIDRCADLPAPMREYLGTHARLWMQPRRNRLLATAPAADGRRSGSGAGQHADSRCPPRHRA